MKMSPKVLLLIALFHLAMGLGWLIGGMLEEMTLGWYAHYADHLPAPAGQQIYSTQRGENSSIDIKFTDRGLTAKSMPVPVISLHQSSSLNSFATYPPEPMDYAVLFRHLYEQGADKVYVLAPLVWDEEPDEIVKAAVGFELDRFSHKAVGLQVSESARTRPLPEEWQKLVIPPDNIHTNTALFPKADKLTAGMPQISAAAQTVGAGVENNELFSARRDLKEPAKSYPLFIRWGDHILPTLPLIAAMNKRELTPQDVRLADGLLLLGNRVYHLNESACLVTEAKGAPLILGTADIIITRPEGLRLPDNAEIRKLLSSAPAVIVSEPSALSDAPDHQALSIAAAIGALLADPPMGDTVSIPKAPAWIQWIFVIDALILSLWALMFRAKARLLIWALSIIATLLLSFYLFQSYYMWVPFLVPVICVLSVALLVKLPFLSMGRTGDNTRADEEADAENDDESSPALPPEEPFEEPKEVPIPHHSPDHSAPHHRS